MIVDECFWVWCWCILFLNVCKINWIVLVRDRYRWLTFAPRLVKKTPGADTVNQNMLAIWLTTWLQICCKHKQLGNWALQLVVLSEWFVVHVFFRQIKGVTKSTSLVLKPLTRSQTNLFERFQWIPPPKKNNKVSNTPVLLRPEKAGHFHPFFASMSARLWVDAGVWSIRSMVTSYASPRTW